MASRNRQVFSFDVEGNARSELRGMAREADRLENEFDRTGRAASSLDRRLEGLGSGLTRMGPLVGGVVAGIAAYQAVDFAKSLIDDADAMQKMGLRLGESTENLSEMNFVLEQNGASLSAFEVAVRTASRVVDEARQGQKEYVDLLDQVGLTWQELQGLSPTDLFLTLSSAIRGLDSDTEKLAVTQQLMGRGGTELLTVINSESDAIERLRQEARDTGRVIEQDFADNAATLNDELNVLLGQVQGFGRTLLSDLTPALIVAADAVSGFLSPDSVNRANAFQAAMDEAADQLARIRGVDKSDAVVQQEAFIRTLQTHDLAPRHLEQLADALEAIEDVDIDELALRTLEEFVKTLNEADESDGMALLRGFSLGLIDTRKEVDLTDAQVLALFRAMDALGRLGSGPVRDNLGEFRQELIDMGVDGDTADRLVRQLADAIENELRTAASDGETDVTDFGTAIAALTGTLDDPAFQRSQFLEYLRSISIAAQEASASVIATGAAVSIARTLAAVEAGEDPINALGAIQSIQAAAVASIRGLEDPTAHSSIVDRYRRQILDDADIGPTATSGTGVSGAAGGTEPPKEFPPFGYAGSTNGEQEDHTLYGVTYVYEWDAYNQRWRSLGPKDEIEKRAREDAERDAETVSGARGSISEALTGLRGARSSVRNRLSLLEGSDYATSASDRLNLQDRERELTEQIQELENVLDLSSEEIVEKIEDGSLNISELIRESNDIESQGFSQVQHSIDNFASQAAKDREAAAKAEEEAAEARAEIVKELKSLNQRAQAKPLLNLSGFGAGTGGYQASAALNQLVAAYENDGKISEAEYTHLRDNVSFDALTALRQSGTQLPDEILSVLNRLIDDRVAGDD